MCLYLIKLEVNLAVWAFSIWLSKITVKIVSRVFLFYFKQSEFDPLAGDIVLLHFVLYIVLWDFTLTEPLFTQVFK